MPALSCAFLVFSGVCVVLFLAGILLHLEMLVSASSHHTQRQQDDTRYKRGLVEPSDGDGSWFRAKERVQQNHHVGYKRHGIAERDAVQPLRHQAHDRR